MNTILIADDNMIFRQVMEVTLKARGYAEVRQRIAGLTQFVGGRLAA